jgi:MoxR-like ATPase
VSLDDVKALAAPALRHRVILNFEGEAEGVDVDQLIAQIIEAVETATSRAKEPFLR